MLYKSRLYEYIKKGINITHCVSLAIFKPESIESTIIAAVSRNYSDIEMLSHTHSIASLSLFF
jgi:hypothetical protein